MTSRLITAPAEEPVDLGTFKLHARGPDGPEEDSLLLEKLLAARIHIENELERPLITSTWELTYTAWPCDYFELLGNTQSVLSVKYTDTAGALQTLAASNYKLVRAYDAGSDVAPLRDSSGPSDMRAGRLYCAYGQAWPAEWLDVGEPVAIQVVAGWKNAAAVPAPIVGYLELLAANWYRNREISAAAESWALALPPDVSPYKIRRF